MIHDTYVYSNGGWWWKCPCGAWGGPFVRRMDADEAAGDHQSETGDDA